MKYLAQGFDLVIGLDEAGRGPLAGPVFAAAVALLGPRRRDAAMSFLFKAVDDSKQLSEKNREMVYKLLIANKNIAWGSAFVSERMIDKINILEASKLAMRKAVCNLESRFKIEPSKKICCLIDGNFPIRIDYFQKSIVGGDARVFSISAASIIAKVARDRFMIRLSKKYPDYGFDRHKGYPTSFHRQVLSRIGACPAHRRSFAPVKGIT